MDIPAELDAQRRRGPDWAGWLDRLPRLADGVLAEWRLAPSGEVRAGCASLIVPVRGPDGEAVLKVSFDGAEDTAHEHLALQYWGGDGAVRMFRADPARRALLLERLAERDLTEEWDLHACEIVAGLYGRLHRPAPGRLRPLTGDVRAGLDALEADRRDVPVPPRLVDLALARGRAFVDDPESVGRIVHGDLHYGKVLAADREPWLAVAPRPMSGDPHYEVAPLLWHRWDEMSGYLRESIQRRFYTVVETAGFDEDRARDWVIVRAILRAHRVVADARPAGRALGARERDRVTRCVSVAKAVQR
ncbi:aminoglycoside phosphotransferase family protein [Tsukamurella ocularis]|uniref:aminoglycoside phosphotransferase family protein n=1 Tax=Tsukamurella ocularis TaxID=1970234 RepID=UPI0021696C64|nr:aminoglycoside phosphotransferase family protein [Tsukamurella ocularis]MCS3781657.1 streptomycin 6-kinase [Tsukamurella ocularis]MCS3788151.1 streptomycin 6-kinase [Tsukamurella ocularis]MCS3851871.1 streptomycin 6-kinase [Tsukamurella ocularis]